MCLCAGSQLPILTWAVPRGHGISWQGGPVYIQQVTPEEFTLDLH